MTSAPLTRREPIAGMFALAIDPEKPRRYREESSPEHEDSCTMCGKMCAVRSVNRIMRGEEADVI